MRDLFRVESFKAVRFGMIYVGIAIMAAAGFAYGYLKFPSGIDSAKVFSLTLCDTSLMFIATSIVSWFVGNDFLNRTIHNEIKLGRTRFSVIFTKTIVSFVISALIHMIYVVSTVAGFWVRYGFDSTMFKSRNLIWSLVILVQIGAIVGCVMFIVFALKKALAGIAFTVVFTFFTCNMLRNFLSDKYVFKLSCFSLAQTSDTKTLFLSGVFAVLTIAAMLALTHWIFRRTEVR